MFYSLCPGDIGDVNKAVYIVIYSYKKAKICYIFNLSFNGGANRVLLTYHFPWIRNHLLHSKGYTPVVRPDIKYNSLHCLPGADNL